LSRGSNRLRLVWINGRANQDGFAVHLVATNTNAKTSYRNLDSLNDDHWYKARGRLVFARVVGPLPALAIELANIEETRAIEVAFADVVDRMATFEGTAAAGARLQTGNEFARVEGLAAWPAFIAGKKVVARGGIRRDGPAWRIERATWSAIDLENQLGQNVALEGKLQSSNGRWWFRYVDKVDLYLTSASGPNVTFGDNDHGRRARASGKLVRQLRTPIEDIDSGASVELAPCFVVKGATVEYLEEGADWSHRFGPIYRSYHTVRDGVPELLAEPSFRKNIIGDETDARLYAERNADVIDQIIRQATPRTRDVLARRANDDSLPQTVRFLYAGILATLGDERGRSVLLASSDPDRSPSRDALYCLGAFLSIAPAQSDIRWAEEPLIGLITSRNRARSDPYFEMFERSHGNQQAFTVADAVARYTEIPRVLLSMKSAKARKAVIDYVRAHPKSGKVAEIIRDLRVFDTPLPVAADGAVDVAAWSGGARRPPLLPVADLLALEPIVEGEYERIAILSQLLHHKHPAAVERFATDLGKSGFVYIEFRDHSSPEIVDGLRGRLGMLQGKARDNARMLVLLGQKDPIPSLLAMLGDPKRTDRDFALDELARLADARAVSPVARLLREAPAGFLSTGPESTWDAVRHALAAIAGPRSRDSVRELVALLPIDLTRHGTQEDRQFYQRQIAIHLIELTGESFGTDAAGWTGWLRSQGAIERSQ
jgi:hypothetical protein